MNNGYWRQYFFYIDQAWRRAKLLGKDDDIALAKRLRNEVKDIIRRARRDFVQEEIGFDEHTPRKFWGKISRKL